MINRDQAKKPFVMPPNEEIFQWRALGKLKEKEHQRQKNVLPLSQRTTLSSRMNSVAWSNKLRKELADIDQKVATEIEQRKITMTLPVEHYHKGRENMAEYIEKKREIFLVQMSLDTKRAEIRKIEDRIFQREEALRQSEEMLAEDSLEFDAFLKQNDEKVQEAIKTAEQQTRLRQDKLFEIKRLNTAISSIKRDLSKYQEQLEDCKKYQDFLLGLTPKAWLDDWKGQEGHEEKDNNVSTKSMFFKTPNQLLEIFADLEEKNITLMQECQDSENILEDLKSKFKETKATNEVKLSTLQTQLMALKLALSIEREQQRILQENTNPNVVNQKYEVSFTDKVIELHARCGLELDSSLGTLQMLTNIEAKLEENIATLAEIPQEFIEQTEKSREKERRLKVREERFQRQREEQERRAQRSLERAQAPIHKRVGKQPMFRSRLFKIETEKVQVIKNDDDKELAEFLARDF